MNNKKQVSSPGDLRQIDMVDYLAKLGHCPTKISNFDYWNLSPLRQEKTPSFKINRKLNCWYDHGIGKGRNLIDFAILYHKCHNRGIYTGNKPQFFLSPAPSITPERECRKRRKQDRNRK